MSSLSLFSHPDQSKLPILQSKIRPASVEPPAGAPNTCRLPSHASHGQVHEVHVSHGYVHAGIFGEKISGSHKTHRYGRPLMDKSMRYMYPTDIPMPESLARRYQGLIKHTDMGDRCVRNKRERQVVPKPWTPAPPTFNVVCMISFWC